MAAAVAATIYYVDIGDDNNTYVSAQSTNACINKFYSMCWWYWQKKHWEDQQDGWPRSAKVSWGDDNNTYVCAQSKNVCFNKFYLVCWWYWQKKHWEDHQIVDLDLQGVMMEV